MGILSRPGNDSRTVKTSPPEEIDTVTFDLLYVGPGGTLPTLQFLADWAGAGPISGVEHDDWARHVLEIDPDLGELRGKVVKLRLTAISGWAFTPEQLRKAVATPDAIVFVINGDVDNPDAREANWARWDDICGALRANGIERDTLPWAFQIRTEEMDIDALVERAGVPDPFTRELLRDAGCFFAARSDGAGVPEAFMCVVRSATACFKLTGLRPSEGGCVEIAHDPALRHYCPAPIVRFADRATVEP